MRFLRAEGIPEQLLLERRLRLYLFQPHANAFFLQHELRGRKNGYALQVLYGTLAQNVKASDRLHLIPPELDPVRIFLRKIKNVNNPAPHGKLPRAVHLIILFVSHRHQPFGKPVLTNAAAPVNVNDILLPVPNDLGRHQRRIGCDNSDRFPLHQPPKGLDPLSNQLVSMDIRLEKYKILCRIQHDISVIKLVFLKNLPGLQIIVSNDDLNAEAIAQTIDHMQFLGIHTARQSHCACPLTDYLL